MTLPPLAPRAVHSRKQGDSYYLTSSLPLENPPTTLGDLLRECAAKAPHRDFLVERNGLALRRVTYAEALAHAEVTASWLLENHHRSVVALSGNSVDHALTMLGCFLAGIPFVPVSPAYSLLSKDFAKLKIVLEKVKPTAIFAETPNFRGLDVARDLTDASWITTRHELPKVGQAETVIGKSSPRELPKVKAEHVAKILFTSGSTGFPKGVPNTHAMLCANQQMITQLWPFLRDEFEPPILVDWLPWSHTFGGNHNFNMVLAHAGTLFVDDGRPLTIDASILNLKALPPTLYFNVPAGFAVLVPRLENDAELAKIFFSRLRVMFYAAAALPPDLWKRLVFLAKHHAPHEVFMTTAWGSTETSPLATSAHFPLEAAGNIGLPAPGVTLKLVPNGNKLEVRVKGPNVMTEYLDEPELTAQAFDDEKFYKIGDAVKFVDPEDPSAGLLFDGRVAEDFKLSSGTWVSVTNVRTGLVALAGGVLSDVVVCGQDRDYVAVLAWPSVPGCRALAGERSLTDLSVSKIVRDHVREIVMRWNEANPGGSTRVERIVLLGDAPDIDAGEITDKGYTNQRATIDRRADVVRDLFSATPSNHVVFCTDRHD
jgi:feruloyl-CoA synthase